MKRKSLVLAILVVLIGSAALACTQNKHQYAPASFVYEEIYSEISQTFDQQTTVMAETKNAQYYFVSTKKEERDQLINATESIFRKIPYSRGLTIYVSTDFHSRADNASRSIYLNPSQAKTINHINLCLQAIFGESTNYGLLYGYSGKVFKQLKWGNLSKKSDPQIKEFLQNAENRYILDLTYGVFDPKFSSEAQISHAQSIALRIGESVTNFLPLIENEQLYFNKLSQFLSSIDIQHENQQVFFKCASYTHDFPVRFYTDSCDYFVGRDWHDSMDVYGELEGVDFEFSYASLKEFFTQSEQFMDEIRNFFEYSGGKKATILLQNLDFYGGYVTYEPVMHLSQLLSLSHEYAHVITALKTALTHNSWAVEGLAVYCALVFGSYLASLEEKYFKTRDESNPAVKKYNQHYDNYDPQLYVDCLSYVWYFEMGGDIDLFSPSSNHYALYAGLVGYILNNYDKQLLFDFFSNGGDFVAAFDKTEIEVLNEYKAHLLSVFG